MAGGHRYNLVLTDREWDQLRAAAEEDGRDVRDIIRTALRLYQHVRKYRAPGGTVLINVRGQEGEEPREVLALL